MTDTTVATPDSPPVFGPDGKMLGNQTSSQGQPPAASPLAPQSPLGAMGMPPAPTPPPQYPALNTPPMPAKPNLQQNKDAPPDAKDYQKDAMAFASAMAVLGAVSSKFVRAPGGAALGAFAGALKGWQTGSLQAYDSAAKEWEQKTKQTIENNKTILEQYKIALEDRKMNIDDQMSHIQLIATKYHDQMMYDAASAKNFTLVGKIYEKNWEFTNGEKGVEAAAAPFMKENAQIQEKLRNTALKIDSGEINPEGVNPATGQPYSEAEKLNMKYIQQTYGGPEKGKAGGVSGIRLSARNEIIQGLTQKLGRRPSEDEINEAEASRAGAIASERTRASAEPRADSAALTQLTKQQAAINTFEKTAIANGKVLEKLADKVDKSGVPVIERWTRAGRQNVAGDTDVNDFNAQMSLYRAEVAKIMVNPNLTGVLSDSARNEAKEFLSGSATAPQIKSVIKLLEGDFGRREKSIDDEIKAIKTRLNGRGGAETPASSTETPAATGGDGWGKAEVVQ